MSPAELRRAREILGLTPDALAIELMLAPETITAWEDGRASIPGAYAKRLAYHAALIERRRAIASSGLPHCPWITQWEATPEPERPGARLRHYENLEQHAQSCEVCTRRAAWLMERFGPMPQAPGLAGRLGPRAAHALLSLPTWAKPAVFGAFLVGAIVVFRMVLLALTRGPSLALFKAGAQALGIAVWMGAAGGVTYTVVHPRLGRLGRPGEYLTGIACVAAALLAVAVPAVLLWPDSELGDPTMWLIGALAAIVFGCVVGHKLARVSDDGDPAAST